MLVIDLDLSYRELNNHNFISLFLVFLIFELTLFVMNNICIKCISDIRINRDITMPKNY